MAYNRNNSVRLAGVVLSGTLALAGAVPAAAQTTGPALEAEAHQEDEKQETVAYLLKEGDQSDSDFVQQAVSSFEEVWKIFSAEEGDEDAEAESVKILVLCGSTSLTEEELHRLAELQVTVVTEAAYQAALEDEESDQEEDEVPASEIKETEQVQEEQKTDTADHSVQNSSDTDQVEELPVLIIPGTEQVQEEKPFIWEAPKIILKPAKQQDTTVDAGETAGADSAEQAADQSESAAESTAVPFEPVITDTAEQQSSSQTGILLPGFSVPTGVTEEQADSETEIETVEESEDAAADEADDAAAETEDAATDEAGDAAAETEDAATDEAGDAAVETEDAATDEAGDAESDSAEEADETEEVEVIYNLFSLFTTDESFNLAESKITAAAEIPEAVDETADTETADASDTNPLVETETEETQTIVLMSLPGIDLVGGGTSSVGGGTSGSSSTGSASSGTGSTSGSNTGSSSSGKGTSSSSSTGSTSGSSTGSTSSGKGTSSSGSAGSTSGSSAGSSSGNSTASGSSAAAQAADSARPGMVQTGDSSRRNLWGVSAGVSGLLAGLFTLQWKKSRREEKDIQ